MQQVVCVDFGSTFTKVAVIDTVSGELVAAASSPTTVSTDVLDGFDAARSELRQKVERIDDMEVLACSSAGGGLRLAVVGYERAITAEAGYRVGLSAGAKVTHVSSGALDDQKLSELAATKPDVVLIVGGTDGGNSEVLLGNAAALASSNIRVPVVAAGNVEAREQVLSTLRGAGMTVYPCANVLPRIGILDPQHARETIREVFIDHVIGGKHLSQRGDLRELVKAATPDAVLTGVELLADGAAEIRGIGDVVVVDVGGATTDVYSVVTPDAEQQSLDKEPVSTLWRSRTVEGDLGVRWNATGILNAAITESLLTSGEADTLLASAELRVGDPGYLPVGRAEEAFDEKLARLAATVALRRHARTHDSGSVRYAGKDLRNVAVAVGSGGVLRHSTPARAKAVIAAAIHDREGGWRVPERARVVIDQRYVLAAAGLLAAVSSEAAARLLQEHLGTRA